MSEHELPPDRSSWPKDPYRLLGVRPGVSARDLRRAYIHLIRTYKPEHAPAEFQLIREAYERLQRIVSATSSDEEDDWSRPLPSAEREPDQEHKEPPGDDFLALGRMDRLWERALRGEVAEAYSDLTGIIRSGAAREETYLQLYWLLDSRPQLDPDRLPCDWLIRGLLDCELRAARLRTLLIRDAWSNPDLSVGNRFRPLLSPGAPIAPLRDLVACRWRAARGLGRWIVIVDDFSLLRGWVPRADDDVWARLVVEAAANMAWAPPGERKSFKLLKNEVEEVARQNLELDNDLHLIEYVERAASGLMLLAMQHGFASDLHDLLRLTWDRPTPGSRSRLMAHVADVVANPVGWFWRLDLIKTRASAALQLLMTLPDQLGLQSLRPSEPIDLPDVSSAVIEFFASRRWWDYPTLRPHLLRFCLSEMIPPAAIALAARDRPELRLPDAQHLADAVLSDWPLVSVYRSYQIVRD